MKIEKMTLAQLDAVSKIEQQCFANPWSRKSLESELNNDTSIFYVAVVDGIVAGYIAMSVVVDEGYIFNVAVEKSFRNNGVGSALINQIITYGKKFNLSFITLEVRQSNADALSLYSKFGFVKVGKRTNYYSNPKEDALLLTKYF